MDAPINSQLSLSRRFVIAAWRVLKPLGYKRNGNTFVYTGKEIKTIVNIQHGKHSTKYSAYSFFNISYANATKEVKTFNDAEFFHFRHDNYSSNGFCSLGSCHSNEFPSDLNYENEEHIQEAMDILKSIEPYFRIETLKKIEETYKHKFQLDAWNDRYKPLLCKKESSL